LHIREYDDKFTVHLDKVDPRKNPLGHLLVDAPEVLVGLAGAAIGGFAIGAYIYKMNKDSSVKRSQSIITGLAASLATGYASYVISKKLKE
jgi:NhaP-type Na+/H+ or K+/H+ antiporter